MLKFQLGKCILLCVTINHCWRKNSPISHPFGGKYFLEVKIDIFSSSPH